jgi:phosphohistidine phosphatase SixA
MIKATVPQKLFLLFLLFFSKNCYSSENSWQHAREGNKILLIRHSLAPGGGDPPGFKINDCKTQRNLNQVGINQSKKIGKLFKKNKISIEQVLSSQGCRCKDTAKYAFGKFKVFKALNSTFQVPNDKNEPKQLKEIKSFIKKWNGKGKNLVLITHYSIITAMVNATPLSGEIVIIDKNLNILATISTN